MTIFLLWLIGKLNRHKDRALAYRLRDMAEDYDPRPMTGRLGDFLSFRTPDDFV